MRVLVVTPYPVLPLTHGGRVRTYRLATALSAAGADVDVLCPWARGEPCRRFRREGVRFRPHFFVGNLLPFVLRDRLVPSPVALSAQPFTFGPRRRLRRVGAYDVVQFEFCAYPTWMERVRAETTTVYSAHNVEYDFWRAQPNGAARTGVLRRLEELERRAVGASDLVITSTDADAARLRALHGGQPAYAVIANGFDESLFRLDRDGQRERARADLGIPPTETVLLFIGGPAAHNQAAVSFLERELMPQLGNGVTLLLAGESCGRSAGRRTDVHAVRRMGYVEDLSPLLAAADIGLNPVVTGSGSNLKVPAYLAAGLPVVTTPIGMRGFERLIEWLTVADLEDFAAAVRAPKPVPASARATLAEWSWTRLGQRLYRVLDDLLADVSPERRGQGGASRPPVPRSGADQARKP